MKFRWTIRRSTLTILSVSSVFGLLAYSGRPAAAQTDGVVAQVTKVLPNIIDLNAQGYETLSGGATMWTSQISVVDSSGTGIAGGYYPAPPFTTYTTGTQIYIGLDKQIVVPGPGTYTVQWYGFDNAGGAFWWSKNNVQITFP